MKTCQIEIEDIYIGGKYRAKKTVFEMLDDIGITVPAEDRFDEFFTTFDFEALQCKFDEDKAERGRTFHYKHVPATVSICSSVPEHTEPTHIRSDGDPQKLVDNFVTNLLEIQKTREKLLTEKYKPYLEELKKRDEKLSELLGIDYTTTTTTTTNNNNDGENDSDDTSSDDENVEIGKKRKRKQTKNKSKRSLLDDEANYSDDDSADETDEEDTESDIEGLINDDVEENEAHFYREFDNTNPPNQSETEAETSTFCPTEPLSLEETIITELKLKIVKKCLKKLMIYIEQHIVIGFNSQKYDIPLIRPYLPSSLIKLDGTPKQIIKKDNGYMLIGTPKLKFLDIKNYLAAGTSLKDFYNSFQVSTPKSLFPYQWFDSLEKLDEFTLPQRTVELREALDRLDATTNEERKNEFKDVIEELSKDDPFYSILTNTTISNNDIDSCQEAWQREGMETFADYVRFYNNSDVIGFVEAVSKMLTTKRVENGLDMFKISVSLPGLTQRYLFSNLKEDYFVGFGKEHKQYAKDLRNSITGGPSIIFHRWQERGKTLIKGIKDNFCRCVKGYDANSLYLYCFGQKMPTGWYSIRDEKDGYKTQVKYSKQSMQWLDYIMRTKNVKIRHAETPRGEYRIDNYKVDGYDEENNTVYEFHGCYHHGHFCHTKWYNAKKWDNTVQRDQAIRNGGYNLVTITSCEWIKMSESKDWYPPTTTNNNNTEDITKQDILNDVINEEEFGFVKVDIHVPEHLIAKFSEFPPLFKNVEIKLEDIGDHMRAFCESIGRKSGVKRSLISSMHAEGIILLTPLLKWYLEQGLEVTRVYYIISYNGKECFNWFTKSVCADRLAADLGGAELKMKGEASKLMGNAGYGHTMMNKAKHTQTSFAKEKNLQNHTKNPLMKNYDELNENVYEVEKAKRKVVHDMPLQIGLAVYSYAKLRMLEFWKMLNDNLVNDFYQFMEMDTDSLYIALARDTLDECVKPERRAEWKDVKEKWFPSEDTKTRIKFRGQWITWKQYDYRTPGKFKLEYDGVGMGCLNSKTYIIWGQVDKKTGLDKPKCSSKGSQQKRNSLTKEDFENVVTTQEPHNVENSGFVRDKNDVINTYTQTKKGLTYFYPKREVLADGVSTTHLKI